MSAADRAAAEWPYGETTEALEARDVRRMWVREIAGVVSTIAVVAAAWQGLAWLSVAMYAAA